MKKKQKAEYFDGIKNLGLAPAWNNGQLSVQLGPCAPDSAGAGFAFVLLEIENEALYDMAESAELYDLVWKVSASPWMEHTHETESSRIFFAIRVPPGGIESLSSQLKPYIKQGQVFGRFILEGRVPLDTTSPFSVKKVATDISRALCFETEGVLALSQRMGQLSEQNVGK